MNSEKFNLTDYNFISLNDLQKVRLLDRQDTKFVFNKTNLPVLLDKIKSSYQVLNIQGVNNFTYENTYFDTDDFLFYQQHHNEKRNRFKVRFRKYSTTNDC